MTTGPLHDLGLTEKRTGLDAPSGGCCGGGSGGCACSQAAPVASVRADTVTGAPTITRVSIGPVTSVLGITGMTSGRCIATVMNELETIQGVESVDVLLNKGGVSQVTVTSAAILDPDAVNRAVDDAGYELADAE